MQRKLQFSIALAQKSPESWRYLWHADEYYSLFHVNELIHDLYLAEEMAEDSKHFNKAQWYCAALFCTELDGCDAAVQNSNFKHSNNGFRNLCAHCSARRPVPLICSGSNSYSRSKFTFAWIRGHGLGLVSL